MKTLPERPEEHTSEEEAKIAVERNRERERHPEATRPSADVFRDYLKTATQ